jgi:Zn-dependent M28 family amino/carboxypeptidase
MKVSRIAAIVAVAVPMLGFSPIVAAADAPDGLRWWSHVLVLADDKLEGRNTGSDGHRKAALYVASELAKAGLSPAGTEGFFQPVRLVSRKIDEDHSSLALVRNGSSEQLALGQDAVIGSRWGDPAPTLEASLVFAGYGLQIPEAHHDDFARLDVRGKVVVVLTGAPAAIAGPLASHMQSAAERVAILRNAGAIGLVVLPNPKTMDIPWSRAALARFMPSMSLADPALDETHGMKIYVTINPADADKLFAGCGHTFAEILDAANSQKPLPHFAIPAQLKATTALKRAEVLSQNVVGILPGSDPRLKDEYVVFTAHLDHLGVGEPIKGDSIYNGAMDNASGVATLLDVAAMLRQSNTRLRRSVLFVAVTAEEKGLLGSRFFVQSPTVDIKKIVADLNIDMMLPLYPFKKLTMFGGDESDLGDDAAAVAKSLGVVPRPDPIPERNVFIRSDQYSFIRRGIPSLMVMVGFDKGSPEEQIVGKWLTERYHAPSDDVNQPVDKEAAGEFDNLVAKLLERIANRESRPRWKDTSFFKRFAVTESNTRGGSRRD